MGTNDFKVIVAGSRDFKDYKLLKRKLDIILKNHQDKNIIIVSGMASGADTLAIKYAKSKGYKVAKFPVDWSFGKEAGFLRNIQMIEYADACILFWDGISRGTMHTKKLAEKKGIPLRVIYYK